MEGKTIGGGDRKGRIKVECCFVGGEYGGGVSRTEIVDWDRATNKNNLWK